MSFEFSPRSGPRFEVLRRTENKSYGVLPYSLAIREPGEMQVFPIGENTLSARNNTRVIRCVKLAGEIELKRDQRLCLPTEIFAASRIDVAYMVAESDRHTNRYGSATISNNLGGNRD
jgi:hypothetical protein